MEANTPESEPIKSRQALSNMMLEVQVTQVTCEYSENRVISRKRIMRGVDSPIRKNVRMDYIYVCFISTGFQPHLLHSIARSKHFFLEFVAVLGFCPHHEARAQLG